jgi:N6-L-threonylcarbamoyladenine synthase
VRKTLLAAERTGVRRVVLGGGVAANSRLRARFVEAAGAAGVGLVLPPRALCTDNAAMVAVVGSRRLAAGEDDGLGLDAYSRMA